MNDHHLKLVLYIYIYYVIVTMSVINFYENDFMEMHIYLINEEECCIDYIAYRGRNKEKLVDRSLILNHVVIFPRAAGGFGGRCKPPNRVLTVMSIRN